MVQASYTIVCKPQPLRHDISRRGSQINLPFFHLVHFFQLYNILKNQNRAFFTPRPPPPSGLNLKLHPSTSTYTPLTSNCTPSTSNYIPSTSTPLIYTPQPQPHHLLTQVHPLNLHLHPLTSNYTPSTSTP